MDNKGTLSLLPIYQAGKSYELFKNEIASWEFVTELPKIKRGLAIALKLPEDDNLRLRSKLFDKYTPAELNVEGGLKLVTDFLDKELGKDDLTDTLMKYGEFEDYRQGTDSTCEYVSKFEQFYNRLAKKGTKLDSEILAYKLLRCASLSDSERLLVISGVDYSKKDTMFEQTKLSLKKFKGGASGSQLGASGTTGNGPTIKLEPAFYTRGRTMNRGRSSAGMDHQSRGMYRYGSGRGYMSSNRGNTAQRGLFRSYGNRDGPNASSWRGQTQGSWKGRSGEKDLNPLGLDGKPLKCGSCESIRHFVKDCPHSWENAAIKRVNMVEGQGGDRPHSQGEYGHDEYGHGEYGHGEHGHGEYGHGEYMSEVPDEFVENCDDHGVKSLYNDMYGMSLQDERFYDKDYVYHTAVLYTGSRKEDYVQLQHEASHSAVLDCACTSTVCGAEWMNDYMECLSDSDRQAVVIKPGHKVFKFGIGVTKSIGEYTIPTYLNGERIMILTDVVKADVPLLFSTKTMAKLGVAIDFVTDVARVLGQNVQLNRTSSGHYCLPLTQSGDHWEFACIVNLDQTKVGDLKKTLTHLHRQMGHPAQSKLVSLIKDSTAWKDCYGSVLDGIYQDCDRCKEFAKTPSKPVVGLPMASTFNEKVAVDLKKWKGKWILHMIDMFSRYTISVFVNRKDSTTILCAIIDYWICYFGVMQGIFSDNGGEFRNDEMREVASVLNFELCSTAAESPFQNGLCEKNHAIVDLILSKLAADYPRINANILLRWANMAKNSLQMWSGFSSNQLVLGFNPRLPSIMCDPLPSMNETTLSEILAIHLNILHDARKAFIQSESEERIKRALRYRIRSAETVYTRGDRVLYKREGKQQWLGPARVVFQDRKVVLLDHGGFYIKVSPNRLVKCSASFARSDENHKGNVNKKVMFEEYNTESDCLEVPEREDHEIQNLAPPNIDGGEGAESDTPQDTARSDDDFVDTARRSQRVINQELGCKVYMVTIPYHQQKSQECIEAKQTELKKLLDFGVYDEVPENGKFCISTRWILWKKGDGVRARLVARGFEEILQQQVDSPTVGKEVMRILITVAASFQWRVRSLDVRSTFLQGKILDREVYLKPPKEANVGDGMVWKLKRCLYGLNDAARKFYESVACELLDSGCVQSQLDPSLYFYKVNDELQGIIVSHIDDFLYAGTELFYLSVVKKLCQRFQVGKMEEGSFRYVGYQICQTEKGVLLDQCDYTDSIHCEPLPAARQSQKEDKLTADETTEYRALVGSLNWIVQGSRPDLSFTLVDLSTKLNKGIVADLIQVQKVVQNAKVNRTEILFPCIGPADSWKLVVYTDASHANLSDKVSSCMGYVVFLVGGGEVSCPITWKANKIKRVVRSTLAAEILACAEGIEHAIYILTILTQMLSFSIKIPVIVYVDHEGAVQSIHSTKLVEDKRLRVDIAAIKECLKKGEVQEVRHCPGVDQLADCLTKKGASGDKLRAVLQNGNLNLDASM